MDHSVAELFVILAINPEKGSLSVRGIHFRYTLTGALIMDFLDKGEIVTENKRLIPSFRHNGNELHDMIADKIMQSGRTRRITVWIRRLTNKSRMIFREVTSNLEKERIIRKERRIFLYFIPYNRYWFIDRSIRIELIERLRGILLYNKKPEKKDIMLLGLIDSARAYRLLARERGENRILRKKNSEIMKGDILSAEIRQSLKEIHDEIDAAITAAAMASHGA